MKDKKSKRNKRILHFGLSFCILIFAFYILAVDAANAASLYFSPTSGSYNVGQTLSVNVYVSSADQAINAASGVISFPQDKLEVTSLSKSGSIFTLWVQEPSFSNSAGTVNFEGIVLNPGFTGSNGKIVTINFKVKAAGSASLTFSSGSVLANDGKGTNILASLGSATFSLGVTAPSAPEAITPTEAVGVPAAPIISSPTHPDSEKWYSNNDPEFSWKLPSDVTGVSLMLTKSPTSNPGNISDGLMESKKFEDVEDGIWYFHIKFRNQYGWGKITHRKVLIDTEPPKSFEIKVDNGGDPTNPTPILHFETTDALSGVEYYEVKIGDAEPVQITLAYLKENPYKIPPQSPGKHTILVKAFDAAGNFTIATTDVTIEPLEAPVITDFPQRVGVGDTLTIKGTSLYPEATVTVFVKKEGEEVVVNDVKTDSQGNWVYIHPKSLEKGTYQVWAEITDKRGAKSNPTEKMTLTATLPTLIKFGKIAIDYLTIMITLIVLIIGLLLIIFYAWYRISIWRKRIRAETKEVAQAVLGAFKALREEVGEQIEYLDKKPGLTQAEREVRDKLKEALDVSEQFIGKELKDVEKELE